MSTRGMTMVIERDYASDHELGFGQDPVALAEKSYVDMYQHHDQYPEFMGVELAHWLIENKKITDGARVASKIVHDMYYESCYLYPSPDDIDHNYTYVIWVGDINKIHISCYDQYKSKNVFVLTPEKVIERYHNEKMDYTKFDEGETRFPSILTSLGYD